MELQDRKKLAKLMVIQDVSQRELARVAGWKTHSYLGRLLRGDAKTLNPEPALRIAKALGVGVDDLFLTKVSVISDQSGTDNRTKKVAA
jgi:transcriptional regulator with XRE-family HTH domain